MDANEIPMAGYQSRLLNRFELRRTQWLSSSKNLLDLTSNLASQPMLR
jgi:hypothetical protein